MTAERTARGPEIRAYSSADREFLARIAPRIRPAETASPRDPEAMDQVFGDLGRGQFLTELGANAFVATIDDDPCGLAAVHPDVDSLTGHARAYVDMLVVAEEAEGRGIGRALMDHIEDWARAGGYKEVVLDIFANNHGAIGFYERCGYRPDHIRMAKPLQ